MRKFILFVSLVIAFGAPGLCQEAGEINQEAVKNTPSELVFVHYNSSLLFVGEYLYYKVYCLNSATKEFSDLSRIAYVELVDSNRNSVFRHKIALDQGTGQGDFFLPSNVRSGNYKLLGYTSWNSNGGADNIFQSDLVIINPYTNDQEELLSKNEGEEKGTGKGDETIAGIDKEKGSEANSSEGLLALEMGSRKYGKREKVVLHLASEEGVSGNYSISVRKKDALPTSSRKTAVGYFLSRKLTGDTGFPGSEDLILPELRGELFRGRIFPKEDNAEVSVGGRDVALSIPGENFVVKISRTTPEGTFFFNVDTPNIEENVVIQVLGEDREKFEVKLKQGPQLPYEDLAFAQFVLTPEMKTSIVTRSVYNQIENGYFEVKPDTVKMEPAGLPFYGERAEIYELDDYTRFKTLKETFVEIVTIVNVKRDNSGDEVLKVAGYELAVPSTLLPLLIVDGVILQEHGDFIHYPAERVKSIAVVRDKYYLGPQVFQGVVNVVTKDGDFNTGRTREYIHHQEFLRPQPEKNYFRQEYSSADARERVPDFRYQLLWQPSLKLTSPGNKVEFFTSDVPGNYEISVEGFTAAGEAVTLKQTFSVE